MMSVRKFGIAKDSCTSATVVDDDLIFLGGYDKQIGVWDVATGGLISTIQVDDCVAQLVKVGDTLTIGGAWGKILQHDLITSQTQLVVDTDE